RPSSVTAEDRNPRPPRLRPQPAGVAAVLRDGRGSQLLDYPPERHCCQPVAAVLRDGRGSQRRRRQVDPAGRGPVAAVLRDGRGSQRLAPQQLVPRVAAWRPSGRPRIATPGRPIGCPPVLKWRPSSVTAEDRNLDDGRGNESAVYAVAAVLWDG